ncbi:MAG: MOSC domain-containing protein YiiM [Bradymonadia bacterium]|jgi:MOSC domain-containing protein YiiM
MSDAEDLIEGLRNKLPRAGRITWIGLRPDRTTPMQSVSSVEVALKGGLVGDRYGAKNGRRAVSFIDADHVPLIAKRMGIESLQPATLRRNIVVEGINLLALKGTRFRVGEVLFEYTVQAHPCSKMEKALGPGGWNAMRGHGGILGRVIEAGTMRVGDAVVFEGLCES